MTLTTKILIGIAVACLLFLIPVVVAAVKQSRKTDRDIETMKRILDASSGAIHDALEDMATQAMMRVHFMSIEVALKLGIPVLFLDYDNGTAEWIGHIDEEYNVLLYDNADLEGEYVDSLTMNQFDLEMVFNRVKPSLELCGAEMRRYREEHGDKPDAEYMQGWVKTNLLASAV